MGFTFWPLNLIATLTSWPLLSNMTATSMVGSVSERHLTKATTKATASVLMAPSPIGEATANMAVVIYIVLRRAQT